MGEGREGKEGKGKEGEGKGENEMQGQLLVKDAGTAATLY